MKFGLISDIHGNLPALKVSINSLQKLNVDEIICLGDIVGLLGFSNECVSMVREHCSSVVLGNHDYRVFPNSDFEPQDEYDEFEMTAVLNSLNDSNLEWIYSLPKSLSFDDVLIAHSNPFSDDVIGINESGVNPRSFVNLASKMDSKTNYVFIGHTHTQHAVNVSKFDGLDGLIVNPGSVGFPFDYDTSKKQGKTSYAVVNTSSGFDLYTEKYDSSKVYEYIIDNELI